MKTFFQWCRNLTPRNFLKIVFVFYVLFLSYLLIIENPFAVVPIDEELVEKGFGLSLSPHVLSFLVLAVLGLAARFRHPVWLYFGMFAYAGGTELLQGALSPWLGRCCDFADFCDDVFGLIYGGLGWWIPCVALKKWGKISKKSSADGVQTMKESAAGQQPD